MKNTVLLTLFLVFTISTFGEENSMLISKGKSKKKSEKSATISPNKIGRAGYLSISGGYGVPFLSTAMRSPLKEIGDKDWYQRNGDLSVKPIIGTNGNGLAFNITGGIMFNRYIGFEAQLTAAWHPEALDARIDIPTYYATQKSSTVAQYLSTHLVMRWDNGKRFGVFAKVGPLLPFHGSPDTRAYIKDQQGRIIETLAGLPILPLNISGLANIEIELIGRSKSTFNPTIGLSAAIGAEIKLNKNFSLFGEVRVQAYTITIKETKFYEFEQHASINVLGIKLPAPDGLLPFPSNINNIDETPEFLKTISFKKEINEESNTARYGFKSLFPAGGLIGGLLNPNGAPLVDPNKPRDEVQPKINASTLYFNAGIRISFPNKKYAVASSTDSFKANKSKKKSKKSKKSKMSDAPDAEPGTVVPEGQ